MAYILNIFYATHI